MAVSKIPHTCNACGIVFYGWTGNKSKYCSQKCYHSEDRARAIGRFWSRVEKTNHCWFWTGPIDGDGYGKSGIGSAHQVSWIENYGPMKEGFHVCHRCNNPRCVRPDHMYAGTPADNMRDRQNAGHYGRGESHPMAVINESVVREIRASYVPRKKGGMTVLGEKFGIATSTVHAIISRKIWKHI